MEEWRFFEGKNIIVGVTGGIAAYKAADLVSQLGKAGAGVRVIMTAAAQRFITPLTLGTLSGRPVLTDLFAGAADEGVLHIEVAKEADLFIVAPVTANMISKVAHGLADDLLSTTLLVTRAPVLLAPAMNVNMYENIVTQRNLDRLRERGYWIIDPEEGRLACGDEGRGRLASVEAILREASRILAGRKRMAGLSVLVTAGGTREPIDPVRYIGNRSSGKMGYAIAQAARDRGAWVTLISGPAQVPPPAGVAFIQVETAQEMYLEVLKQFPETDLVVKAAAVADFQPVKVAEDKIKKNAAGLTIRLKPNPDILLELGRLKKKQVLVGFAAETRDLLANAVHKMHCKNLDLMVANDVTRAGAGFGSDTNIVSLLFPDGQVAELPQLPKLEVAHRILDYLEPIIMSRQGKTAGTGEGE